MIITGTVNLQTCNVELLVELAEATQIALEQRKQALKKTSRREGIIALTDFERRLIGSQTVESDIQQFEEVFEKSEKEALDEYVNQ